MVYINLTPHDVVMVDENGNETHRYEPSGNVAHLDEKKTGSTVNGDPIIDFGQLTYNPPARPGVIYIVPLATALAIRRDDFRFPYQQTRRNGQVHGCQKLAQVAR